MRVCICAYVLRLLLINYAQRVGVHVGMRLESWHFQPLGPLCCIDHCITDVTDVPADTSLTLSKEHARHDTLPIVCLPSLFYSSLTSYANSVGEHYSVIIPSYAIPSCLRLKRSGSTRRALLPHLSPLPR